MSCSAEDRLHNKRRGALAVGSGNAGNGQPLRWMAIKIRTQSRQGAASVGNLRPGNIRTRLFGRGIAYNRDRSRHNRLIDKFVSIARFAAHRHEGITSLDLTRIVFEPEDLRIAALGKDFRSVE